MNDTLRPVVVVIGSLHHDIMVDAPDRPMKGETVAGYSWRPKFGGKGGNQAVAASRAGADVRMCGAVGDDDFGRFLLAGLAEGGVDNTRVSVLPDIASGMSVAIADSEGDYGAVTVSGANLHISPDAVEHPGLWRDASAVILQNEVSEETNIVAATVARSVDALVCLNAAPCRPISEELKALVDVLIVNAVEAEQIGAGPVVDLESAMRAAETLGHDYRNVVVTVGGDGVAAIERGEASFARKAIPVKLVSTHGAGDMFVGTLVSALAQGRTFPDAIDAANAAAAAHVSSPQSAS